VDPESDRGYRNVAGMKGGSSCRKIYGGGFLHSFREQMGGFHDLSFAPIFSLWVALQAYICTKFSTHGSL
jgi:hypothetical protein